MIELTYKIRRGDEEESDSITFATIEKARACFDEWASHGWTVHAWSADESIQLCIDGKENDHE